MCLRSLFAAVLCVVGGIAYAQTPTCLEAVGFSDSPFGDPGGWAVACLPLNETLPPDSTWTVTITIPEQSGACEDSAASYARAGVILVGSTVGCDPAVPQMQQDYIVLDEDVEHNALGLAHFDHGVATNICYGAIPTPTTRPHTFRVRRSPQGEWRVWIDEQLWCVGQHMDLPDEPGFLSLINIYCSGVVFELDVAGEWAFPYGTWEQCAPTPAERRTWGSMKAMYR